MVIMRDTKELTKLMDKHNLHIGNREDEEISKILDEWMEKNKWQILKN